MLQVGPYIGVVSPSTSAGAANGPFGEIMNALGFKSVEDTTVLGTPTAPVFRSNPTLANAVTVHAGGLLAIANDQANANPNYTSTSDNPTPPYYQNPVTLSGGSLAATGAEVTFNSSPTAAQGVVTASNSAVVARFGGDFNLTAGSTSTILTYDPNGSTYTSTDGSNSVLNLGLGRTIELVGGSQTLTGTNSFTEFGKIGSAGLPQGTVVSYAMNWAGNLVIASSNGVGGTFNIKRSSGVVNVASGTSMTIQPGAIVNISNDNSSTMVSSTASATYGLTVYDPTQGSTTLPVLNNVLSAGGNSVAIANSGAFNVNAGRQTIGAGHRQRHVERRLWRAGFAAEPGAEKGHRRLWRHARHHQPGRPAASMTIADSGTIELTTGKTAQSVFQITGSGALKLDAGSELTLTGSSGVLLYNGTAVKGILQQLEHADFVDNRRQHECMDGRPEHRPRWFRA